MSLFNVHNIEMETSVLQTLFRNSVVNPDVLVTLSQQSLSNVSSSRFSQPWILILSIIPAALAAYLLVFRLLRPLQHYLPQWSKRFNQEYNTSQHRVFLSLGTFQPSQLSRALGPCIGLCLFFQLIAIFVPSLDLKALPPACSLVLALFFVYADPPSATPHGLLAIVSSVFVTQLVLLLGSQPLSQIVALPVLLELVVSVITIFVILNMPMRDPRFPSPNISQPGARPNYTHRSPEDNLTLLQFMTVSWMWPLISRRDPEQDHLTLWQSMTVSRIWRSIKQGNQHQLDKTTVWSLAYEFQHQKLHEHFQDLKGSIVRRLLNANGLDLMITGTLGIIDVIATFSVPVLLQQLLRAMEDSRTPKSEAFAYAALTLVARLVSCQSSVFSTWFCRRCYERSRGEMMTTLYEKTLSRKIIGALINLAPGARSANDLSTISLQGQETSKLKAVWSNVLNFARLVFCCRRRKRHIEEVKVPASMGKILNLMRHDTYEVAQRFWEFPIIVRTPIELILSVILIWKLIGWPCFLGTLTVVVAQIINAVITRILLYQERKLRKATDKKLNKISEFVTAIRHLRWYGWQETWLTQILESRSDELRFRVITSSLRALVELTNQLASGLFPVLAFFAYTKLAGLPLRIDIAFPAITLFSMLENNLRSIPDLITTLLNAKIAVDRLEDFMSEPDTEEPESDGGRRIYELELRNASFAWPGADELVLYKFNLRCDPGLTVISGKVGTGKSALLQAILGELDMRDGHMTRPDGMIGYCAQTPWLQSMNIRDNILFTYPYDEDRYKKVLEACALMPDLASFKDGDRTNIGENGIGLSGGQKARVALARAVYSRSKLLLLDDPLSAVDHQTAEFIVYRCLCSQLIYGRVVLIATHRTYLFRNITGVRFVGLNQVDSEIPGPRLSSAIEHGMQKDDASQMTDSALQEVTEDKNADPDTVPEEFIEEEHRVHGGVQARVYWEFVKAGKLRNWVILILIITAYRMVTFGKNWFLKAWGEAYRAPSSTTMSAPKNSGLFGFLPSPEDDINPWLVGFLAIAIIRSVIGIAKTGSTILITYTAGKRLFIDVMNKISHATFRYYDVTPIGRLMNRMTSDLGTVDGGISQGFYAVAWNAIMWILSVAVIASITPIFLVFSILLSLLFVFIFRLYLPTSQSLRRLEMVSLSPMMSNFGVLLEGLATIRAFHVQDMFQLRFYGVVDTFQRMDHFYWTTQTWLTYRFEALSAISTFVLTLLALFTGVSPGWTAFALIAAQQFVNSTHNLCKTYGQLQMDFVSVERVVEMLHVDQEPKGDIQPPAAWPKYTGDIEFQDVTVRYAPNLEPSLSGISLKIPAGSTTALIGRTGSGKSTLALSLLATVRPDHGTILIDGIDISRVDTQALRSRITFLAQDPVLFPGTMRQNLDPLNEYTYEACGAVLLRVCAGHGWSLDMEIETGGKNLSQGQRQLVGLARAVLRRSAIVILDEATASIDMETAMHIQQVLREELEESTVITIAHRIEAVRDADFFVRLGNGKVLAHGPAEDDDFSGEESD